MNPQTSLTSFNTQTGISPQPVFNNSPVASGNAISATTNISELACYFYSCNFKKAASNLECVGPHIAGQPIQASTRRICCQVIITLARSLRCDAIPPPWVVQLMIAPQTRSGQINILTFQPTLGTSLKMRSCCCAPQRMARPNRLWYYHQMRLRSFQLAQG